MGSQFYPQTNLHQSLTTYSPFYSVISTLSYGTLLTITYPTMSIHNQHCGDEVLLSLPDQQSSLLHSKRKSPFRVILITPTSAKLDGLPRWIHLSHFKPFIPSPQDNLPSYTSAPVGCCSFKVQKTPKSTIVFPIPEECNFSHVQLHWIRIPIWKCMLFS